MVAYITSNSYSRGMTRTPILVGVSAATSAPDGVIAYVTQSTRIQADSNGDLSWTFPIEFMDEPIVTCTAEANPLSVGAGMTTAALASITSLSTTDVSITTNQPDQWFHLIAIDNTDP